MNGAGVRFVVAFHLLTLTSSVVDGRSVVQLPVQLMDSGYRCRCVPDQWEGVLASVERELEGPGRVETVETSAAVHYDYVNKRFAMIDMSTGRKAVADYRQGYKYVVDSSGCFEIQLDDEMTRMCLPEETEYIGDFILGTEIPVAIWQFTSTFNFSTRTTVMKKNCVPISEEIYMSKGGYASMTSSLYVNVRLGIRDQSVFEAPADCSRVADEELNESSPVQETVRKRIISSYAQPTRHHQLPHP